MLSNISSLVLEADGKYVWNCEFSNAKNEISTNDIYKPRTKDVTYKIEDAPTVQGNASGTVIFALDISSSMVDNKEQGKTRYEWLKKSILDQIEILSKEDNDIKVGFVTFGFHVEIYGDGS